ncbi:MAG: hypothetical protein EXX96DRAFT_585776 [Benjaminiella poitrasii]|nr:MAG: hypothetical protein EXX96DRAFT_585776 [Benjaminiella poitrasii]
MKNFFFKHINLMQLNEFAHFFFMISENGVSSNNEKSRVVDSILLSKTVNTSSSRSLPTLTPTITATTITPHMSSSNSEHSTIPIASRIDPDEVPPTPAQIDIVRYTWERVSEIRLEDDDPNISSSHAFGLAFYEALFELEPSLRPLFPNIFQQARALAGMISFITRAPSVFGSSNKSSKNDANERVMSIKEINARKRKETAATTFPELVTTAVAQNSSSVSEEDTGYLLHKLRELGARHFFYHVEPYHLSLVGPAVLMALQIRLGEEFLPEVAEAWTRAHAYAAYHMKCGLESQENWEKGRKSSAMSKISSVANKSSKTNCSIQ